MYAELYVTAPGPNIEARFEVGFEIEEIIIGKTSVIYTVRLGILAEMISIRNHTADGN
jgi:hypothetical protein